MILSKTLDRQILDKTNIRQEYPLITKDAKLRHNKPKQQNTRQKTLDRQTLDTNTLY